MADCGHCLCALADAKTRRDTAQAEADYWAHVVEQIERRIAENAA